MADRILSDDFLAWLALRPRRKPQPGDDNRGRALLLLSLGLEGASNTKLGEVMDALAPGKDVYETARRNSRAGKGRRGYQAPLSHAVKRLRGMLPAPTLEHLLAVFRDDENGPNSVMADLYASRSTPIDICIQEVHDDVQRVDYLIRGGQERSVTFEHLKKLLRR